jgi:hypothetical protein
MVSHLKRPTARDTEVRVCGILAGNRTAGLGGDTGPLQEGGKATGRAGNHSEKNE